MTSRIAGLDVSDAEDEPGLVEEGARSPSTIWNILYLNLQPAECDFDSALWRLCREFSAVGIDTLPS
jgi:hypothetical protein